MIYVLTLVLSSIFAFCYDHASNKKQMTVFFIFTLIMPFFVMALRYGVGQDYFYTYVPVFNSVLNNTYSSDLEIGFLWLNKFCQVFTDNPQSIFMLTSILFCFFIFGALRHHMEKGIFCLAIYIFIAGGFYLYSFNVVRQCLATAIFCFSLKFIDEKKPLKYFILIFFASLIHKSALVYFPFYFIAKHEFKTITYLAILILILIFSAQIVAQISKLLVGTKYYNYITGYYNDSSSKTITASQMLNILVFIYVLHIEKTKKPKDKFLVILGNVHYVGIVFTLFMGAIPLIFRMSNLFYLLQFISVPYIIKRYVPKKLKNIGIVLVLLIYGFLFVNTLLKNGNNILPYQTFFNRW